MKAQKTLRFAMCVAASTATLVSSVHAVNPFSSYLPFYHERPTHNQTCDPRPNILPDSLYNHHAPYRLSHNRPRYVVGYLATIVEPSSQEAMAWHENYCQGNYETKHAPAVCKTYMYPKPWEALNVGPRPDTTRSNAAAAGPYSSKPTTTEASADQEQGTATERATDRP